MKKIILSLVTASLLTLAWSMDMHLSTTEKFNKAFLPSPEVRVALETLESTLSTDKDNLKSFHDLYESKLTLRTLNCSQGQSISIFTSIEKIKSLPVDKECLKTQDTQLMDLIGTKMVGYLISQPTLHPLDKIGHPVALYAPEGASLDSGSLASRAGVATHRSSSNDLLAVEVPSGKKLSKIASVTEAYRRESLSPNGRVVAVPIGSGKILFADTETGQTLWTSPDFNEVFAWMPEISAVLVKRNQTRNLALVDLVNGKIQDHTVSLSEPSWAIKASDNPSRYFTGNGQEFVLIEHTRPSSNAGIEATALEHFKPKQYRSVSSSASRMLMLNGKAIAFASSNQISLYNLETLDEKIWETNGITVFGAAKISEDSLLIEIPKKNEPSKAYTLNVNTSALSPVLDLEMQNGAIMPLTDRTGFMRREHSKTWVGDELKVGASTTTLTQLISEHNLEMQMARLEAEAKAMQARIDEEKAFIAQNKGLKPGEIGTEMRRITLSDGRFVNIQIPRMMRDPEPIRPNRLYPSRGSPATRAPMGIERGYSANASLSSKTQEFSALARQQIGEIPSNAKVEAIGVYETLNRSPAGITVLVKKTEQPIVLLLASYEPVKWNIIKESGANITAILVTGYNKSSVTGAGATKTVIKNGSYAISTDDRNYSALNREAMLWTGKAISKFQGTYGGVSFVVGN